MEKRQFTDVFVLSLAALLFFAGAALTGAGKFIKPRPEDIAYYLIFIPAAEEIVFRGILQKNLSKIIRWKIACITGANIAASLVFSVFHMLGSSPIHAAAVFWPSLVFGLLYQRYGSILPPALVHGVFNVNVFIIYQSHILYKIL